MTLAIFRFTHHDPEQHFFNVLVDLDVVGADAPTLLARARDYAYELNDFYTADFAAAFIQANRNGPGSVCMLPSGSWQASAPADVEFVFTTVQLKTGHVRVFGEASFWDPDTEEWRIVKLWDAPLKRVEQRDARVEA
ncbi:hypothetical protein [Phenylobacterium sp.]|uniref:hypothetical protein n=1 Tax=Phenylobacterium sp. TaxID=1871053 RepID=UPI0039327412